MTRRRRALTPEEIALWQHVIAAVAPLKPRRPKRREAGAPEVPAAVPPAAATPPAAALEPAAAPKRPAPRPPPLTPLATLDRHELRRIARGSRAIEGRIDLHGMRQDEAHGALRGFLRHAQGQGLTIVLVITGKGRESPVFGEEERGVLRRVVPQWLRMADLRPLVVGFEEAHQGHGGGGALYVRLRKSRRGGGS